MKKKLIGFGAGGHSKVILDIIKIRKEYSILGLIDKNYKKIKKIGRIPVLGDDKKLIYYYNKGIRNIYIGGSNIKESKKNKKIFNHLYKIGFTIRNIEDRTKNAKDDPTYLLADVKVVALYKCLNLNSQKLEHLLHKFFYDAKLDIKIHNINSEYSPKEWFDVPLSVIDEVINIAIKGNIENYKYEKKLEQIIMI